MKNINEKQTDLKCPECDPYVRNHMRNDHKFGHIACQICGNQFSSQVVFDHHIENTHTLHVQVGEEICLL